MATLAELWGEAPATPAPVRAVGFPVVTPNVQRTRDIDRQKILGQELAQNQAALASATTPETRQLAQSNIDSLNREMGGRTSAPVSAPITMATPAGNTLADLWESTPATAAPKAAAAAAVPTAKSEEQQLAEAQTGMAVNPMIARQGAKIRQRVQDTGYTTEKLSVGDLAKKILQPTAALADIAIGAVPAAVGQAAYAVARPFTTPEGAQEIQKKITEPYQNVIGRAAGITQEPGYTGEATTRLMNFVNENMSKGAQWISEKTGAPLSDVENMMQTASLAVPGGARAGAKLATQAGKGAVEFVQDVATTRQQLADQFAQKRAPIVPPVAAAAETPVMKGGGAAVSEMNPYRPFPNEEPSRGGVFPLLKSSKTVEDLKLPNQQQAVNIVQEVLGPESDVRPGVVTQNLNTLKNEYTEANLAKPTPRSDLLKRQIANEQTALSEYAKNRIAQTGADTNLVDPYARGERINNAFAGNYDKATGEFQGLTGFLKKEKSALYDEAKRTVGTNPIESSTIEKLLNNPQFNSTAKASKVPLEGFKELLQQHKTTGFENAAANSINSMEEFRKSINRTWSPDNKYFIGKMVNSIDEDIAKAGGPGLLKQARNLHQAEKTLFASKGIKTMFGEIDPNGVQLATKFEDIPKKLNSLGADEWKHIYDTADQLSKGRVRGVGFDIEVPPEIRQAAQSAKNEMRGSIAREIYEAGSNKLGVWNQNDANKIMNARWQKIKYAFDPDEVKKLHTLNYAGQLMPGVHAYEGAALQGQRLQGIIESNLGKLGATVGGSAGGFLAGPPGAAAGAYMGGQLGLKGAAAMEAKALKKSAEQLQKEMKRNAQLGKNNIKDIGK